MLRAVVVLGAFLVLVQGCDGRAVAALDAGGDAASSSDASTGDGAVAQDQAVPDVTPTVDARFEDVAVVDAPAPADLTSDTVVAVDVPPPPPDMMCRHCREVANLLLEGGGQLPDFSAISEFCPESQMKLIALAGCVLGDCSEDCADGISVGCGICVATTCGDELGECAAD